MTDIRLMNRNEENGNENFLNADSKSVTLIAILAFLIFYVVGLIPALIVLLVVLVGESLGRFFKGLLGPLQWLLGIILVLLYLSFYLAWSDDVIERFKSVDLNSNFETLPFYSIPYTVDPIDPLTRTRVLTGLVIPLVLVIFLTLSKKRVPRNIVECRQNHILLRAAIFPVFLSAFVKFQRPDALLAAVMSGDSRNHLILTETIRLNGELVIGKEQWGVPKFGNGLAAFISAGNGAIGTLNRLDIEAMLAVHLLSFVGIAVAFSAGILITGNFSGLSLNGQKALAILSFIASCVVLSSLVMGIILVDGFLSLSVGVLLLTISLVCGMKAIENPSFLFFGFFIALSFLMLNAYTFLVLPCIAVLIVIVVRGATIRSTIRRWWFTLMIGGITIGGYLGVSVVGDYWSTFSKGVARPGSIVHVSSEIGWALFFVGIGGTLGLYRGIRRSHTLPLVLSMIAAFLTVQLIETVPGNEAASLSYYGQKAFIGIVMANIWALFIPFVPVLVFRAEQWNLLPRARRIFQGLLEVTSVAVLPLLIVSLLSPLSSTAREIWRGWNNPDSLSISSLLDEWSSQDDYVFWRFVEDPNRFSYPAPQADRVANLWSPATWDHGSNRGMAPLWNWIYYEVNGDNPQLLCAPIRDFSLRIITRDPLLEEQVQSLCGENSAVFDVRPRLANVSASADS